MPFFWQKLRHRDIYFSKRLKITRIPLIFRPENHNEGFGHAVKFMETQLGQCCFHQGAKFIGKEI